MEIIDAIGEAFARCTDIIDVRSPGEFALDHAPGAVNLPVLTDAERAEVGTIYVQQSKFKARRIGAAHIARNVASHLEGPLSGKPGGFSPLIYCWRGGQRSTAMATILSQVGWRVRLLKGGYMTYRRHVTARLYGEGARPTLVLLDGGTGSAKTEILGRLAAHGVQTLDLEALASHRGSVFGGLVGPQPSQKLFESRLLQALDRLDPGRPIVVEAEASRIGDCTVPPVLWDAMRSAPRIELSASPAQRARYLVDAYGELTRDVSAIGAALDRLPPRLGAKWLDAWRGLAERGEFEALALDLIARHYDPAYSGASRRDTRQRLGVIQLDTLGEPDQVDAAARIARLVAATRTSDDS